MSELSEATKAAAQITIDGKTYELSPLEFKDWGEFDEWMYDRVMERAGRAMDRAKTDAQRDSIQRAAQDKANTLTISALLLGTDREARRAVVALLFSPAGIIQAVWRSLRHKAEGLTLEAAAALCEKAPSSEGLINKILTLSGVVDGTPQKKGAPPESKSP